MIRLIRMSAKSVDKKVHSIYCFKIKAAEKEEGKRMKTQTRRREGAESSSNCRSTKTVEETRIRTWLFFRSRLRLPVRTVIQKCEAS